MRIFSYVLLLLIISFTLEAQQVKKIDCCQDVTPKATIIINESTSNGTTSSTTTTSTNPTNGVFNFELKSSLNTSAGVYNSSGVLIRTLWSGVRYDVGCYSAVWDGYLDDGVTVAPVGNYTIKLLTNNVQYTWEGGIGDSSTEPLNDNTKLRGNDYPALVVVGQKVFYSWGYSEHSAAVNMLLLSDINKRASVPNGRTTQNTLAMCTDGNIVYSAGDKDADNDYQTWVIGSYPADNADPYKPVPFSKGQSITAFSSGSGDTTDPYAIGYDHTGDRNNFSAFITGFTVQKNGSFLFISRSGRSQLQVLNKITGALIIVNQINSVGEIAADANAFLYALVNNVVKKYTVNNDGTITDTGISFTGLASPSKLTYSIETGKLAVFDNSTFQVKIYNHSGGNPVNVIGQPGGYTVSPYFSADRFVDASFIYYQEDGTLWLGQPALHSVLHYNLDFTLKEETQHLPTSRACAADQNNPTRVFSNYNEFTRDYSKTLDNGTNGSWKFSANWAKGANTSNLNYDGIVWDCTLSNGRNYALIYTGGRNQLNELTSTGPRLISDYFSGDIGRDGTLYQYGDNGSYGNQPRGIYKSVLTGFDSNNNPVWSSPSIWIPNPPISNYVPWRGYQNKTSGLTAASDGYIYFDNGEGLPSLNGNNTQGYRLGKVKASTGQPAWKTARTTSYNYSGPYPVNGDFDIGNNNGYYSQHSETHAMVYDGDVFWNVNGEFWKDSEANYWNHVDAATGLLIGHFGTDGNLANLLPGKPQMAGNAFSVAMVKIGNDYYIYHCDESVHAFVHSWKISGLNTVNITTVPITVSTPITLPADPADMMAGIPYRSNGFYGGSGWTMNPAAYYNPGFAQYGDAYPNWRVSTSVRTYSKSDIDVAWISDRNANGTITRDLGANNTNNWTLSGSVMQDYYSNNDKTSFDIVDATGKTIVTFHGAFSGPEMVNNQPYISGTYNVRLEAFQFANFKITCTNGSLSFSYAGQPATTVSVYDNSASKLTPKYFRVRTSGSNNGSHSIGSLKGLRFVKN